MAKDMVLRCTNVPPSIGSWRSPIDGEPGLQEDAKRSQEQLRALTACVKEAAKASDGESKTCE